MMAVAPRFRVALAATVALVLLAGMTACQPAALAISASVPKTLALGTSTAITGKVTPARTNGTVVVERLMSGKWVERARGTLSSNSTYSVKLTPSERTTYTLRARRLATGSDAAITSSTVTMVVGSHPNIPAAPVVQFKKDDNNGGAGGVLHVSWTPPHVNGPPIQGYRVRASSGAPRTVPAGTTSMAWTGLTNGTPYTFQVTAYNAIGESDASPSSAPQTPAGVPGAVPSPKAQRVTDGRNDNGGIATVSWNAASPNGDPQNLRYRITTSPTTTTKETDQTTAEWSGLNPSTAYTFQVIALNKAGDGPTAATSPLYAEGKPAAPAAPRFLPNNGAVQLSGISSADTKGPGTISYEYSTSSASSGFRSFNGSSFLLANGTTASVWVRSCKYGVDSSGAAVGCGSAIQASNSVTGAVTVTPFGPPQVSASVSDRTITWTWSSTSAGVSSFNLVGQEGGDACGSNCYRKTFGYGETRCLRVDAVGQGVTMTGSERCASTASPPPGTVTISKGAAVSTPDCPSGCQRIVVSLSGFGAGSHQVSCWGSAGGWAPFYSYTTTQISTETCYYGYPGTQVYVVVDGVQSNTIAW
jgi:hypothetical protein